MACCAFAIFLIGQVLAFFGVLRRWGPFGRIGSPATEAAPNLATAWQLHPESSGAVRPQGESRRRNRRLAWGLALGIEVALMMGGVAWLGRHMDFPGSQPARVGMADVTSWCGTPQLGSSALPSSWLALRDAGAPMRGRGSDE